MLFRSQADIGRYIELVRNHVTILAREQIQQDIQSLNNNQGIDEEDKSREKENMLKKLKRLSPGESSTINAMVNDMGRICTTPEDIAEILKKHWQSVFNHKHVNTTALQIWMEELYGRNENGCFITGLPAGSSAMWVVSRSCIKSAIKSAKLSMPGPDGISARAYKALGDNLALLIADLIHDLLTTHIAEDPAGRPVMKHPFSFLP